MQGSDSFSMTRFFAFYGTRIFNTVVRRPRTLSWARLIRSTTLHCNKFKNKALKHTDVFLCYVLYHFPFRDEPLVRKLDLRFMWIRLFTSQTKLTVQLWCRRRDNIHENQFRRWVWVHFIYFVHRSHKIRAVGMHGTMTRQIHNACM